MGIKRHKIKTWEDGYHKPKSCLCLTRKNVKKLFPVEYIGGCYGNCVNVTLMYLSVGR